jgi:hypothetical protein
MEEDSGKSSTEVISSTLLIRTIKLATERHPGSY